MQLRGFTKFFDGFLKGFYKTLQFCKGHVPVEVQVFVDFERGRIGDRKCQGRILTVICQIKSENRMIFSEIRKP